MFGGKGKKERIVHCAIFNLNLYCQNFVQGRGKIRRIGSRWNHSDGDVGTCETSTVAGIVRGYPWLAALTARFSMRYFSS